MKLTQEQYDRIADVFPTQRGNVSLENLTVKIHLVAATARQAVIFCLSAGNEGDARRGAENC